MALLPEMMHAVHDGIRLAKEDAPTSMKGEGFVWFTDRLLSANDGCNKPSDALRFLRQAAELGTTSAFVRIGQMHETGTGTERNLKLALAAYSRAAVDDDAGACEAVLRVVRSLVDSQ